MRRLVAGRCPVVGLSVQAIRSAAGTPAAPADERSWLEALPKALRGLFERDRKLLGLLPRCAFGAVRLLYQEHFARRDALPGMVASIQTFGSALNFNPHVHALVTDGLLQHGGAFLPLTAPDLAALVKASKA